MLCVLMGCALHFCSMAIFFWAQLWHGFYILLCTEIQVIASEGHCVVASLVYGFAGMREMHTYVNKQQNDHLKHCLGSFGVSSIVVTDHIPSYLLWFSSWLLDGLVSLFTNTVDWPNYGEEFIVHIFTPRKGIPEFIPLLILFYIFEALSLYIALAVL